MYNHYLNHGKENDEWVTIVVTLRDIIESIQPLKTVQDLNKLKGSKDRLVETALEYLNLTNQSKKDIEAVIQGLEDVYQNHIDNADFSEEEIEEAQEVDGWVRVNFGAGRRRSSCGAGMVVGSVVLLAHGLAGADQSSGSGNAGADDADDDGSHSRRTRQSPAAANRQHQCDRQSGLDRAADKKRRRSKFRFRERRCR